jgi:hypothetical protein
VAAAASLMELARAEVVGAFNNRLFARLLTTALTNASVRPEVGARCSSRAGCLPPAPALCSRAAPPTHAQIHE